MADHEDASDREKKTRLSLSDSRDILLTTEGAFSGTLVHLDSGVYCSSKASLNVRTVVGLPMQKTFLVQVFAVKKAGGYRYRSAIYPADRALEGALFCEKWHKDESEIVQVLRRILPGTVDVAEVLSQAQSFEGSLMELELTDSEATLLGWRPELLDD